VRVLRSPTPLSGVVCPLILTNIRIRQYENRISKWGLEKKVKTFEMVFIARRQRYRRLNEPGKRKLKFKVRGVIVTKRKISGFEKRNPNLIGVDPVLGSRYTADLRSCQIRTRADKTVAPADVSYRTASESCGSGSSCNSHLSPPVVGSPGSIQPAVSPTLSMLTVELSRESRFQGRSPKLEPLVPPQRPGQYLLNPQDSQDLETTLRQAFSDHERRWGSAAPPTLLSLQELGDFLLSQGRYKSAEATFRKLADTLRGGRGVESEQLVTALQRLGNTLLNQGRASEGERMIQKAYAMSTRLTGDDSPTTLGCLSSLASARLALGRTEDARLLHAQALDTSGRVLGDQHIETLLHLVGTADTCRAMGRLDEAESMYRQLLQANRGHEFPSVQALTGLAVIHSLRGQHENAISYTEKALEGVRGRGVEHPSTLGRQDHLAAMYCVIGRLEEAETLCDSVFERKRRVLGDEHPETILNRMTMANIRLRQGRLDEAETICQQSFGQLREILGPDHPRTVANMLLLVDIWHMQGQEVRALEYFEYCVERRRVLLPEHPNTTAMVRALASWKAGVEGGLIG